MQDLSRKFTDFIRDKLLTADQKAEAFCGRTWVFDVLRTKLGNTQTRAVVISGSAGVGKSSFVAKALQVASQEQRRKIGLDLSSLPSSLSAHDSGISILAYHFCKHNDSTTLDVQLLARSLAISLSNSVPGFLLSSASSRAADPEEAFRLLVLEPLALCKAPDLPAGAVCHCILIDSLDESLVVEGTQVLSYFPLSTDVSSLLQVPVAVLVGKLVRETKFPAWLKVIATTRPETRVLELFTAPSTDVWNFDGKVDDGQRAQLERDTELYFRSRVASDPRLKEAAMAFVDAESVNVFADGDKLLPELDLEKKKRETRVMLFAEPAPEPEPVVRKAVVRLCFWLSVDCCFRHLERSNALHLRLLLLRLWLPRLLHQRFLTKRWPKWSSCSSK